MKRVQTWYNHQQCNTRYNLVQLDHTLWDTEQNQFVVASCDLQLIPHNPVKLQFNY